MGRVRSVRDMKSVVFLNLWDGSCLGDIQVVGAEEIGRQMSRCSTGDVVEATGRVVASAGGKQAVELSCQRFAVLSKCPSDYPLQKKRHSLEYLRTIGHLRPRTNTYYAAFKVRSLLCHAIHQFFREEGFVYVHTPLITGSDCEGAGEMFQVTTLDLENPPRTEDGQVDYSQDFFGKKDPSDGERPAQCRGICHGVRRLLYLWPHLPCREQQYGAPRRGVLDGGTLRWPSATLWAIWTTPSG